MKRISRVFILAFFISLPLVANGPDVQIPEEDPHFPSIITENYVPGVVIVKLTPQGSGNSLMVRELFDSIGVTSRREMFTRVQEGELSNIYVLHLSNPYTDVIELSRYLEKSPLFEYSQPDYYMELAYTPADPFYHSAGSWGQPYDDK